MSETPKAAASRLSRAAIRGEFTPEALHVYTSADGAPLYWRIRARLADGSKWIRPMRLNGHGYELGNQNFPRASRYIGCMNLRPIPARRFGLPKARTAPTHLQNSACRQRRRAAHPATNAPICPRLWAVP